MLDLEYVQNHDTAFSLLRNTTFPCKGALLAFASVATLAVMAWLWWRRRTARRTEHVAFALIAAGAIGNIADRVRHGYVVDFIHVHAWPVFNVADVSITLGAALLLAAAARRMPGLP